MPKDPQTGKSRAQTMFDEPTFWCRNVESTDAGSTTTGVSKSFLSASVKVVFAGTAAVLLFT